MRNSTTISTLTFILWSCEKENSNVRPHGSQYKLPELTRNNELIGSLNKNRSSYRVSFYDIQDFISNNISIPEEKYNLFLEGENLHLLGDSANYSVDDQYRVYNYKFVENNYSFELTVNDYNEGRNFPKKQTFKFDFQEKIEIVINYLSYEFKGPQKIIFNIPKHYARLN